MKCDRIKPSPNWREKEVSVFLQRHCISVEKPLTLLDVGAGPAPYRKMIDRAGLLYLSHDFGKYQPNTQVPGEQNEDWDYGKLDYKCDIEELPYAVADRVLCTDVLEHVPDPIAAVRSVKNSMRPGGRAIFIVPFASMVHQAPFFFSNGYSTFFFLELEHRMPDLKLLELKEIGDYFDLWLEQLIRPVVGGTLLKLTYPLLVVLSKLLRRIKPRFVTHGSLGTAAIFERRL